MSLRDKSELIELAAPLLDEAIATVAEQDSDSQTNVVGWVERFNANRY